MTESSRLLQSGKYQPALKVADRLCSEMVDRLGPGDAATTAFGTVLVYKALANAGLGRTDDALWYWYTALSLYPGFGESDMSMFGKPGEFLKNHPLPAIETKKLEPVPSGAEQALPISPEITRPKVVKKVKPKYPAGAKGFRTEGQLIVQVVITRSGAVTSPRIIKALPAPTLSYVALEALKQWRFEPAKIDGKPVDVFFTLTVNYKLHT